MLLKAVDKNKWLVDETFSAFVLSSALYYQQSSPHPSHCIVRCQFKKKLLEALEITNKNEARNDEKTQ